jgi:hypothetical protein
MIRSVVVAVTLTLGAVSPVWAQDAAKRTQEEAVEGEEELEGARKKEPEAAREDESVVQEEEPEAAREEEPAAAQEEELEGAPDEALKPEEAETGEPAPPPPPPSPPGPTFQDQLGGRTLCRRAAAGVADGNAGGRSCIAEVHRAHVPRAKGVQCERHQIAAEVLRGPDLDLFHRAVAAGVT